MKRRILFLIAFLSLLAFVSQVPCAPAFAQANPPANSKNANEPGSKPGTLNVDKEELKFDQQSVDSTSPVQTVAITVEPPQDSTTKFTATTAGDFSVTPSSCELKGSGKCAFSVSFAPKSEGPSTSALTITTTGEMANLPVAVDLQGKGVPCGTCVNDKRSSIFSRERFRIVSPALIVVLLYLVGIILIRWNMIARPTRNLLQAAIESVRTRVATLKASLGVAASPGIPQIESLLDKADRFVQNRNVFLMLPDYILWNRGQEISAWNCVHEAEEQMVLIYPPNYEPFVRAELEQAKLDLVQENSDLAKGMAALIADALEPKNPPPGIERMKALLNEALGFLYNRTDNNFSSLISWQNKTVWLIGCSLLLIVSLSAALQHEVFFLVGATGGLLSRLSRSLQRADVPTDYGASWTTLFLSPVVGALGGWCGVLLIALASEWNVVGSALKVNWSNPYSTVALGAALLLGTSERAFDSILTQLEDKVKAQTSAAKQPQPADASKK
jgi:hypothetical protein